MKTLGNILIIALVVLFSAFNNDSGLVLQQKDTTSNLRNIEHNAFKAGEILEYRLHYGIINAGTARLEIKKLDKRISNREVYHIIGIGRSRGAFDWFFKVRDRYETYMDVKGVFPWLFVRDISEGGYKKHQMYKFAQNKNMVDNGKGEKIKTPQGIQDMLSSFYYARSINYKNAKIGEVFTIWSFVDDEIWPLKIRLGARETIKVAGKKYKALRFHPVVQEGRLFENEEDVAVWISDDGNKIPLLAQGKVLVGSVKMELTKASGLANPLAIID